MLRDSAVERQFDQAARRVAVLRVVAERATRVLGSGSATGTVSMAVFLAPPWTFDDSTASAEQSTFPDLDTVIQEWDEFSPSVLLRPDHGSTRVFSTLTPD